MAGTTERDNSASLGHGTRKKKRRRKRQQVRRHFKPSLGRWVETYDRRGEHARRKTPRAAGAEDVAPAEDGASPPTLSRRLVVAGGLFALVLATIAIFRLVERSAGRNAYEILAARSPVMVRIERMPPTRIATAAPSDRDNLMRETVDQVVREMDANPGRLVVLEFVSPTISFNSLTESDQLVLRSHFGKQAAHEYETAVADFALRIVKDTGRPHLGVLGLPVEAGAAGEEAARRTNRRYGRLLDRLEQLVTGHVFLRSDSTLTEQQMVVQAIPEALRRRSARPVVFRSNASWRVLLSEGALESSDPAPWRTLVAGRIDR